MAKIHPIRAAINTTAKSEKEPKARGRCTSHAYICQIVPGDWRALDRGPQEHRDRELPRIAAPLGPRRAGWRKGDHRANFVRFDEAADEGSEGPHLFEEQFLRPFVRLLFGTRNSEPRFGSAAQSFVTNWKHCSHGMFSGMLPLSGSSVAGQASGGRRKRRKTG